MPRCATLCKGEVSKYSILGADDDYFWKFRPLLGG
jgi:hypothetical protein